MLLYNFSRLLNRHSRQLVVEDIITSSGVLIKHIMIEQILNIQFELNLATKFNSKMTTLSESLHSIDRMTESFEIERKWNDEKYKRGYTPFFKSKSIEFSTKYVSSTTKSAQYPKYKELNDKFEAEREISRKRIKAKINDDKIIFIGSSPLEELHYFISQVGEKLDFVKDSGNQIVIDKTKKQIEHLVSCVPFVEEECTRLSQFIVPQELVDSINQYDEKLDKEENINKMIKLIKLAPLIEDVNTYHGVISKILNMSDEDIKFICDTLIPLLTNKPFRPQEAKTEEPLPLDGGLMDEFTIQYNKIVESDNSIIKDMVKMHPVIRTITFQAREEGKSEDEVNRLIAETLGN